MAQPSDAASGPLARLFPGASEMAARMRAFDWSQTPLGVPEGWPQNLRTALGICLTGHLPLHVWWGPSLTFFYNDACIPLLGPQKHPAVLGRPGREAWAEVWPQIGPVVERALSEGAAGRSETVLMVPTGAPRREEDRVTFSFSPVFGEGGRVDGLFCACTEESGVAAPGLSAPDTPQPHAAGGEARRRAEEALRETEARHAFLLRLNERLRGLADPAAIQFEATRALAEHLRASGVGYAEDRGDARTFAVVRHSATGAPGIAGTRHYQEYSAELLGVLRAGRTVVRPDVANDPTLTGREKAAHAALDIGAAVNVPLLKAGRLVAVLFVHQRQARAWSAGEVALAEEVADRTWAAAERERAEAALRASERHLRLALSAARMGTWSWDPATNDLTRDAGLNALLGLPEAETTGPLTDLLASVHPDDRPAVRAALYDAAVGGAGFSSEFRVVWPDGTVRWLRGLGGALADDGRGLAGVCVDVTDRRGAEESLREREERLRRTIDSATDYAILTMDPLRRITSWSPGARAVFGYAAGEVLGRPADLLFTPEDRDAGAPEQEAWESQRSGRAEDERWHLRKDNSRFFASGVLTPLGLAGSLGYVKVLRDLTERKRMEDELRAARADLERRVAERTAELAGALESLEAEMTRRHDLTRRLATAQEDERRRVARDLHDTVGQTLTGLSLAAAAGRVEQVKALADALGRELHEVAVRLRPTVLDDVGLAAAARVLAEAWGRQTGVAVQFQAIGLAAGRLPPEVETALYRAVQEALTNAAKHAGARNVSVVLGRRNGQAVAVVEDDGTGFDPGAARPPGKRGGLGLPGMRERVALLGGEVEVESEPGHGTTVIARIPLGE